MDFIQANRVRSEEMLHKRYWSPEEEIAGAEEKRYKYNKINILFPCVDLMLSKSMDIKICNEKKYYVRKNHVIFENAHCM